MPIKLRKPKSIDIQETNLALFGSDTEKQVKKETALLEAAWENCEAEGLRVWRIINFQLTLVSREDYGKFFNGDSYIILNAYRASPSSEELSYDVHFWIGMDSTADEYGTAAYKTVELDTFLDDRAVQHREVEGQETELLKSYFEEFIVLNGGADSGFRHVVVEEYKSRLIRFCGQKKNIQAIQVPANINFINSEDAFILDLGNEICIWYGSKCNHVEKSKAMTFGNDLSNSRNNCKIRVFDEGQQDRSFLSLLTDDDADVLICEHVEDQVVRVSNEGGDMSFVNVEFESLEKDLLDSNDVFIINHSSGVFVWIGQDASITEKRNGITYAQKFVRGISDVLKPITVIKEGLQCELFEALFTN